MKSGDVFENKNIEYTYQVIRAVDNFEELQSVISIMKNIKFPSLDTFKNPAEYPVFIVKNLIGIGHNPAKEASQIWLIGHNHEYLKATEVIYPITNQNDSN